MHFKKVLVLTIVALCLSPSESLFLKKKLILGKLGLKSKLLGLLGAGKLGKVGKIGGAVIPIGIGGAAINHPQEFELGENSILIPQPEPVIHHIYAPPPPPAQVVLPPPPPPQIFIQQHEPAPIYSAPAPVYGLPPPAPVPAPAPIYEIPAPAPIQIASVPISVPVEIEEKPAVVSSIVSALNSIKETAAAYNPLNLLSSGKSASVPVVESKSNLEYNFVPNYGFSHYKKVNYIPVMPTQVIHQAAAPPPNFISSIPSPIYSAPSLPASYSSPSLPASYSGPSLPAPYPAPIELEPPQLLPSGPYPAAS